MVRRPSAVCPDEEDLAAFADGRSSKLEEATLKSHLETCAACRSDVSALLGNKGRLTVRLPDTNGLRSSRAEEIREIIGAPLPPGAAVGRYVLLECVGSGGMGHVYKAYDPSLDRRIALKLLRPSVSGVESEESLRARVLREAQAMARLSHPNVLTVHDVEMVNGRVAIAMAFVNGPTLKTWLGSEDLSWNEIRDLFVQAGRGLAAAHAAGLVHRDFKPDNVLVDKAGRACVTDFGLVRQAVSEEELERSFVDIGNAVPDETSPFDDTLTRTGTLLGTPAYMAPEQILGGPVDARTDQFSFSVALWEALYGMRPFSGKTLAELKARTLSGEMTWPSKSNDVPSWLRDVLLRALAAKPEDRYPSMNDFLRALTVNPTRRRWTRVALAAAIVVFGGLVFGTLRGLTGGGVRCEVPADEFSGVWDDSARDAIERAFNETGVPHADEAASILATRVSKYVRDWSTLFIRSCEETHKNGTLSPRALELRIRCLRRHRKALQAFTKALTAEKVDRFIVDKSVRAVQNLPAVEACVDPERLANDPVATDDPATRARVEELRVRMEGIEVLRQLGKYERGVADARDVVTQARELGVPLLEATAHYRLGWLYEGDGQYQPARVNLQRAAHLAALLGDEELYASAATSLIWVIGVREERLADAEAMLNDLPESLVEAAADPGIFARFLGAVGAIKSRQGHLQQAVPYLRRTIAELRASLGEDHYSVALSQQNLGITLQDLGQFKEARSCFDSALAIVERTIGRNHPLVAHFNIAIAALLVKQGEYGAALEAFDRWLPVERERYGAHHPFIALALIDRAWAALNILDTVNARAYLLEARALLEQRHGWDHPTIGLAHVLLGEVDLVEGKRVAASRHFRRALEVLERTPGSPVCLAWARSGLARVLWNEPDRRSEARELAARARQALGSAQEVLARQLLARLDEWLKQHNGNMRKDPASFHENAGRRHE